MSDVVRVIPGVSNPFNTFAVKWEEFRIVRVDTFVGKGEGTTGVLKGFSWGICSGDHVVLGSNSGLLHTKHALPLLKCSSLPKEGEFFSKAV